MPTLYPLWGGKHLSASTYGTTPYHSPPYGANSSHPVDGVRFRGKIQPNFVLLVIIAGSFISNITISATGTGYINYPDQMHSPWEGFMENFVLWMDTPMNKHQCGLVMTLAGSPDAPPIL